MGLRLRSMNGTLRIGNIAALLLLLVIPSMAAATVAMSQLKPSFTLRVQGEDSSKQGDSAEYSIGQPVVIKISITNNGEQVLAVATDWNQSSDSHYQVTVRRSSGEALGLSEYGRAVYGVPLREDAPGLAMTASVMTYTLKPGESTSRPLDVGKLYDLTQPGTYSISIGRWDENVEAMTFSKPCVITVIP